MEPVPGWPEVRQPRQGVMLRPVHGREAWPAWRCGAGCGRKYVLAGQQPFEKAKADIKNYLTNQKQLKLLDDLTESLKKNAKIEYVNSEYDPKTIQDKLQKEVKQQKESAKTKTETTADKK